MGVFDSLDAGVTNLFGQWNVYSTGLVTLLLAVVSYRVISTRDPDVHPMLLARQAVPSSVRNEGESPIYRSQAAPHGMPLNTGLNVKDTGASKWSRGRDGDLRDIWKRAAEGGENGAKGRILTVLGSQNVVDHKLDDITRQINLIGQHIAETGGIRVAVYLPNSVELLVTLFACSFYQNLTTVLIPFDVSNDELVSMLRRSAADTLITAPGAFPFDAVIQAYPSLRQLIWVTDEGSSHMDWNEIPEGTGGNINVATWQDILRDAPAMPATSSRLLTPRRLHPMSSPLARLSLAKLRKWCASARPTLSLHFCSTRCYPTKERINPSDLFLPADSLANVYTLVLTLGALYSNASIALNSVAGKSPDLVLATQGVAPTVLVASPETLLKTHEESTSKLRSSLANASHVMATRSLAWREFMPPPTCFLVSLLAQPGPWHNTGKLRLVLVAERAGSDTPLLPANVLSDLRIFTGARVVYALTAAKVAGAICQTALYDYRLPVDAKTHFGPPLTSVELYLKDAGAHKTTDEKIEGHIVVRGPSVAGGEVNVGIPGKIRHDNTLAYA
ncbi:hypothetical protein ACKAV7_004785 [Fusarium commune]